MIFKFITVLSILAACARDSLWDGVPGFGECLLAAAIFCGTYLALTVLAFLFLHEQMTAKALIGCVLIAAGTLVMVL